MINGFEEETSKLTDYELELAEQLLIGLRRRVGSSESITAKAIVKSMTRKGFRIKEPRVRKIIHYLVATKQLKRLVATSKGYYIAESDEEVEKHVESLIQRAVSILVRAKAYPCYGKVAMGVKQHDLFVK